MNTTLNGSDREILHEMLSAPPGITLRGLSRRLQRMITPRCMQPVVETQLVREVKREDGSAVGYKGDVERIRAVLYPPPQTQLRDRVTRQMLQDAMYAGLSWSQMGLRMEASITDLQELAVEYGLRKLRSRPVPKSIEEDAPVKRISADAEAREGSGRRLSAETQLWLWGQFAAGEGVTTDSRQRLAEQIRFTVGAVRGQYTAWKRAGGQVTASNPGAETASVEQGQTEPELVATPAETDQAEISGEIEPGVAPWPVPPAESDVAATITAAIDQAAEVEAGDHRELMSGWYDEALDQAKAEIRWLREELRKAAGLCSTCIHQLDAICPYSHYYEADLVIPDEDLPTRHRGARIEFGQRPVTQCSLHRSAAAR